ncbi:MAG: YihY/virulence factor BrkB family protein [Candidatus Acidiferrales bacterium]
MSARAERWTFGHARISLLRRIWRRIQRDDCFDLAAQTSFYFVLSLFPFCLVLAIIVGRLPSSTLWSTFAAWIVKYLPRDSRNLVLLTILRMMHYSPGFLSFGLLATIWSASAGFVSLMESLSIAYGTKDTRSYWIKHAIGTVFTILAAVFALATFGVMAFGHWELPRLLARVTTWSISRSVSGFGRWTASAILLSLAIDFINFVLPNAKRPWRWLSPGTIFVVLTLVLSSFGFNLYFQYFASYPRIYGAIGGFIVLMLWIYLASVILLVGAETDSEIEASASRWGGQ